MRSAGKTKKQLIKELEKANQRIAKLEASEVEPRRKEAELLDSEGMLRAILDATQDSIFVKDLQLRYTHVNSAMEKLFSTPKSELLGKTDIDLFGEVAGKTVMQEDRRVIQGEVVNEEVTKPVHGVPHTFHTIKMPLKDSAGNIIGLCGVARDITERKKIEADLMDSAERSRILFEYAPYAYYLSDLDGNFVDGNKAAEEMVGFKREELIGKNYLKAKLLPMDQIPKAAKLLLKNAFGKATGPDNFTLRRKDGTLVLSEISTYPVKIKDKTLVLGIAHDVTERNQIQDELKRNEEKYRTIFELSPEVILTLDKDGRILDINRKPYDWVGYTREEIIGKRLLELPFFTDESRKIVIGNFLKRISGGKVEPYELEFIAKNGEKHIGRVVANLIKDTKGEIAQDLVIIAEITEMKRSAEALKEARNELEVRVAERTRELTKANEDLQKEIARREQVEESLRESEEKLRRIIESSPDTIAVTDLNGIIVECNQAAVNQHNYSSKEDVIGKNAFELIAPKDREQAQRNLEKTLEQEFVRNIEYTLLKSDGSEFPAELSSSVVRDSSGKPTHFVATTKDITERKRAEIELINATKLESLSILAGGIAHDFNNILTGILGGISLADIYLEDMKADKVSERLREVEKACVQANCLTQQLLTFSKGGQINRKVTSIAEILRDSVAFALSGSNVKCEFSISNELWSIEANEGQINRVISNLVINADQAMPEGGTIGMSAENVTIGKEHNLPLKEGEYVKISLKDEGIGIPDQHLPKIFDPYFTTKKKGNGLGLATSYSIIKNHGGHISVESKAGLGTTFHLYLPAHPDESVKDEEAPESKAVRGDGKVLIMDDEKYIRDLASEMLNNIGYITTTAEDGSEAVEIYQSAKESGNPYDAVILDIVIPGGMGGKEAIQRLMKIDPEVKAIVSSGYSDDPMMTDFEEYGFKGVIAKPYKTAELGDILHRTINGASV